MSATAISIPFSESHDTAEAFNRDPWGVCPMDLLEWYDVGVTALTEEVLRLENSRSRVFGRRLRSWFGRKP